MLHGAGGGAPKGNKNALRHGHFTAEAVAMRQAIRALLRDSGEGPGADRSVKCSAAVEYDGGV
jgi:hypothetical protein